MPPSFVGLRYLGRRIIGIVLMDLRDRRCPYLYAMEGGYQEWIPVDSKDVGLP